MTQELATPPRITLQDIANHCGVTKGTVSLALRSHTSISAATTARIVAAAKELGYNPEVHNAARRLAMLRKNERIINKVIALFHVPGFYTQAGGFTSEIFRGVLEGARNWGYGLLVDYLPDVSIEMPPLLPIFERSDVDGAIMFGRSLATQGLVERLRNTPSFADRPITLMLRTYTGCSSVGADEAQAAYATIKHLVALGHRHICQTVYELGNTTEAPVPAHRIAVIQRALREAGLDPETHHHLLRVDSYWTNPHTLPAVRHIDHEPFPQDENSERLLAMIRQHPEITAVVALNDPCAFRVWQTLHRAGIAVPDEISVVGFDDTDPVLDERGRNLLTTVRVPLFEIGFQAAQLAIAQIQQPTTTPPQVLLPAELVMRESTAPTTPAN